MQKKCAFVLSVLVVAMILPGQAHTASEQEKNKAVVRAFEDVMNQGKLETIPTSTPPTLWPIALSAISLWLKIWRRRGKNAKRCPTCSSRSTI